LNKSAKPVTNTADQERKQKNERECQGGKARCEPRRFLTGVAEPIHPLALFFYIYIYLFLFFCFFFHTQGGADWGKPREEKNIAGALAFLRDEAWLERPFV
jgi:hypothetical protein